MKRKEREPLLERAKARAAEKPGKPKPAIARKPGNMGLDRSEQLLRSVLQGSPVAKFVIGRDHRVVHWNRALEELSGIPAREVLGTAEHWRAFYRSGARPCLADLLVDGDFEAVESWYAGKCRRSPLIDEAYEATDFFPELGEGGRWLRFTAALIRGAGGEVLGALETLENITEQKRAEEELHKAQKMESLSALAGGIAQDFNTLLSAILRNVFLAKISVPDEDKMLEEGLAVAEKAGLRAKELVHLLITVANLVVGWGLWHLREWARIGAIALAVVRLFNMPLGTLIGGLIIWHLLRQETKAEFAVGVG